MGYEKILSVFLLFLTLSLSPQPQPQPYNARCNPRVPSLKLYLAIFPTLALSPRLAALSPNPSPNRLSPAQQSNCFLRPQWRTRASRASIAMMMRRGERERGRQIEKMLTADGRRCSVFMTLTKRAGSTRIHWKRSIARRRAALTCSVRRLSDYSSSLRDLKDCTHQRGTGCPPRDSAYFWKR